VKLVDIWGTKNKPLTNKFKELETDSMNENAGNMYRAINELQKCYQPWTNLIKDEEVICLQIPTKFWIHTEMTSASYWMYMGSQMYGSWSTHQCTTNVQA
jgi:hypothetical protein